MLAYLQILLRVWVLLTAVLGGKFPHVQLFEGEVDIGREFTGSDAVL